MSTNMKTIEFNKPTYEQWQEEAVKALKGKPFDSLFTKTLENITLEPLYTREKLIEKLGDQLEKQIATIRTTTSKERFATAQQIYGETKEAFLNNLQDSIARGNELIVIDSHVSFEWDDEALQMLADYFTEYPFKLMVTSKDNQLLAVFEKIEQSKRANVEGYVVCKETVSLSDYPNIRVNKGETISYHYAGANAVQELAIALAAAKEQLGEQEFESFAKTYFAQFAIDTQFFMEIAKVRAFKVLWKAFASAYGVNESTVPVVAETSVRSFSKLDVYVNLLRTGNAALSAAIGGVDVFTIHPHDCLSKPTEQSIRIARNVSLVTKEESHVLNVIDPAGGSYFVESLTADLVKEAWSLFLEIEEAGGLSSFQSTLDAKVAEVKAEREKRVATRKDSLIGTNIYANPKDILPGEENPAFANIARLAEQFEALRETYSRLNSKVAILTFGQLKNYKPRADYVSGVLAVAGVEPTVAEGIETIEQAKAFLSSTDAQYVIVATTDEDTKLIVPELLQVKPANILLDVAGKYKDEADAWVEAGLNGFIFAGQNIVEKLQEIAAAVGEA